MPERGNKTAMHSRWICLLVSLLLLFQTFSANLFAQTPELPEIGDPAGRVLTPAEETRLGKAFMRSIRKSMDVLEDPLMNAYIQRLGEQLVAQNHEHTGNYTFFIVKDPTINAFAGPDGYIGINTGLITTTQNESELASVLAHEIAHVTQRHLVRAFDAVSRLSLPAAALALAAVLIGAAADNPEAAIAAATGIQAGMLQRHLNFTRAHEEEADNVGMRVLADAGFNPGSMPGFFSRMAQANRTFDSGEVPEFLRTHPVSTNRIANAYGRAGDYRYRQKPDSLDYHLLKARLKAENFSDPDDAVTFFRSSLEERRFRNEEGQRYGYVLSLERARNYPLARHELRKLLTERPTQIDYLVAEALLLKKSGQPAQSLQVLQDGFALYPSNLVLGIYLAQSLLDSGRPVDALNLLESLLPGQPDNTQLLKLLARSAGDSGNKTLGHQYLAEYQYQLGNLQQAVQHLEFAYRDRETDYFSSAKIAARLNQIRDELRDEKEREKEPGK